MHSSKTSLLKLSTIHKGYKEGEFDKTKTPNLYQESQNVTHVKGMGQRKHENSLLNPCDRT